MGWRDHAGYADEDGRCYDEEGYDVTDAVEQRECFSCGGVPSRSAEPLHSCNDCGELCCTSCLERSGLCSGCRQDAEDRLRDAELAERGGVDDDA